VNSPNNPAQLAYDLTRFPTSPTLNGMALRNGAGVVIGMSMGRTALETAYFCGAEAELVVEAERLGAFIGSFGDRGHHHRAVRLAHLVRDVNRRLGVRALGTLTVLAPMDWPAVALHSHIESEQESSTAECLYEARAGHDPPPPLDAASTAPHRPCAPPTSLTRGHEWLPRVSTVGTHLEGEGVIPLAA
jgi:hypothetical protein